MTPSREGRVLFGRTLAPVADALAADFGSAPEQEAYSHALEMGRYDGPCGMFGKYDNVRRFWEDRVTAFFLSPSLERLVARVSKQDRGLRILDLGCGVGDGLDLIRAIAPHRCADLRSLDTSLVTEQVLEKYVGLDLNENLLAEGLKRHAGSAKVSFVKGDLSGGLPGEILRDHEPFDLYFSSYAMLSHFSDQQFAKILADVCDHAPDYALFVGDWLGHYSYEWPSSWRHVLKHDYVMDYRMSYLYTQAERSGVDIPVFPLRLMTGKEILSIAREVSARRDRLIKPQVIFDRSILAGRHTDTGEYHPGIPHFRTLLNSLLEYHRRTDLAGLLLEYVPKDGFDRINSFYERFFGATNRLVRYSLDLLENHVDSTTRSAGLAGPSEGDPCCLVQAMETMRLVIDRMDSVCWGDARANLLEPALGYALRHLEIGLQSGIGVGHSLGAVLELSKQRGDEADRP